MKAAYLPLNLVLPRLSQQLLICFSKGKTMYFHQIVQKMSKRIIFLFSFFTAGFPTWATGGPSAEVVGLPLGPGLRMDPYFVEDQPTSTNLSVHAGQKAYLECRVRNLGAKRVSQSLTVFEIQKTLTQNFFNELRLIQISNTVLLLCIINCLLTDCPHVRQTKAKMAKSRNLVKPGSVHQLIGRIDHAKYFPMN